MRARALPCVLVFCLSACLLGCDSEPELSDLEEEVEDVKKLLGEAAKRKSKERERTRERVVELTQYVWESSGYESLEASCSGENYAFVSDEIERWRRDGCSGDHPLRFSFVPYPRREDMSTADIVGNVRFCLFSGTTGKGVPIDSMFGSPSVDFRQGIQIPFAVNALRQVLHGFTFNQPDGLIANLAMKFVRMENRHNAVDIAQEGLKHSPNIYRFVCGRAG